jgi:ribosomal protein S18 acetylase RimI-like enzyme
MTALERRLLENHHAFTARHRGAVLREEGIVRWESASEAFSCVLLESASAAASVEARAVRTFPWSSGAAPELGRRGYEQVGCLRYMVLARTLRAHRTVDLDVRRATREIELAGFSYVQSHGFVAAGEPVEPLYAFLHEANRRNLHDPAQTFFVGYLDRAPAAVTLLLVHDGIAGIYAVATLPGLRRRGFSRALLGAAMQRAQGLGCDVVTLQVERGSDAEQVYVGAGFEVLFDSTLWSRS